MSSTPSKLPIPPRAKMHRSTLTAKKPSSLIARPMKGSIQASASQGKMVPLSKQILQQMSRPIRSPSVGVHHSSSSSIISSLNSDRANAHEIRIRVFSNCGNPSFISCSGIDVLNDRKQNVPISSITLEPKRNAPNDLLINSSKRKSLTKSNSATNLNLYDFSKLTNGSVMEKDESKCWHAEWPPEYPMKYIDIVLIVKSPSQIDSIRIWPNKYDVTQNFKHISVFLDQSLLFDKETENEFGLVVPLLKFDSSGKSRVLGSREQACKLSDEYGILPIKAITKLEIDFLKAYNSNKYFGLQQIIFYDSQGEAIDLLSKGIIQCINCGKEAENSVNSVFSAYYPEYSYKWVGELNKNSSIIIKFFDATIITAFSLITLPENSEMIDLSIKQIKIKFNGFNVWCGMINRGLLQSERVKERMDTIFLYDNPSIKEKVLQYPKKTYF